jgi:hypothetical protein
MADDLRERLLASYADLGQAMVIQNVLETEGIPCRVGDLADLPAHVLGIAGGMRRSVGLWVLEADVERATTLLATLGAPEAIDEEALAAEALAAAPVHTRSRIHDEGSPRGPPLTRDAARPRPWVWGAAFGLLAAVALPFVLRGCS